MHMQVGGHEKAMDTIIDDKPPPNKSHHANASELISPDNDTKLCTAYYYCIWRRRDGYRDEGRDVYIEVMC